MEGLVRSCIQFLLLISIYKVILLNEISIKNFNVKLFLCRKWRSVAIGRSIAVIDFLLLLKT